MERNTQQTSPHAGRKVVHMTAHNHGIATTAGYIVRRTFFGARAHEDAGTFGADGYGQALERVREVRAEGHDGYAVIDTVYSCGCRGRG
jgi:hypothetical protein